MRIITGSLRGRNFDSPRGNHTHPMGDKIRGALFNILGDLDGLTVLDAFAGSGALSLEAISRGAVSALAIDQDKEANRTILANVTALGLEDQVTVLRRNVASWTKHHRSDSFSVVIADPPYNDIRPDVLRNLAAHTAHGGTYVISYPGGHPIPQFDGLEMLAHNATLTSGDNN